MSFLIAVLVGAVLLGGRLGSPSQMRRRAYQVSLGVTLSLFALAVGELVLPSPDINEDAIGDFGESDETIVNLAAEHLRERATFLVGDGLLLALAGLFKAEEWPTSHLALILSGLILLISGLMDALENDVSVYAFTQRYLIGEAGPERNGLYALVLGVGALVLSLYGFKHWDNADVQDLQDAQHRQLETTRRYLRRTRPRRTDKTNDAD